MISTNSFWINIVLLMIGTFSIRYSAIAISSRIVISDRTREIFSFIPAAILPALLTPMVFYHKGIVEWAGGKERLLILAAATVVCFVTRSTLATIGFGLLALFALTY